MRQKPKRQVGRIKGEAHTIESCNATTRRKNDGDWRIRFQAMKHVEVYLMRDSPHAPDMALLCCYLLYLLPLIYIFHVLTATSKYVYACVCVRKCVYGFTSVSMYVIFFVSVAIFCITLFCMTHSFVYRKKYRNPRSTVSHIVWVFTTGAKNVHHQSSRV